MFLIKNECADRRKPWKDWDLYLDKTDDWLNLNEKFEPLMGIDCERRVEYIQPWVGFETNKMNKAFEHEAIELKEEAKDERQ